MTITTVFDPPLLTDTQDVFNLKAFDTVGKLNTWAAQANATADDANSDAVSAANSAAAVSATAVAAQADRVICQAAAAAVAEQSPVSNAAAAAAAAAAAQTYASQAQATNPDSPIRLNPRRIAANFTVPTGYNAASTGPITVADGVAVTVATGASWSVH